MSRAREAAGAGASGDTGAGAAPGAGGNARARGGAATAVRRRPPRAVGLPGSLGVALALGLATIPLATVRTPAESILALTGLVGAACFVAALVVPPAIGLGLVLLLVTLLAPSALARPHPLLLVVESTALVAAAELVAWPSDRRLGRTSRVAAGPGRRRAVGVAFLMGAALLGGGTAAVVAGRVRFTGPVAVAVGSLALVGAAWLATRPVRLAWTQRSSGSPELSPPGSRTGSGGRARRR